MDSTQTHPALGQQARRRQNVRAKTHVAHQLRSAESVTPELNITVHARMLDCTGTQALARARANAGTHARLA
eukprot:15482818-Alexandrium_andersonii.AAC.2